MQLARLLLFEVLGDTFRVRFFGARKELTGGVSRLLLATGLLYSGVLITLVVIAVEVIGFSKLMVVESGLSILDGIFQKFSMSSKSCQYST